jgi:hypothetical protein
MFILIAEDGSMCKIQKVDGDVLQASDDGLVDVVHIEGENPTLYVNGAWTEIETV